VTKNNKSYNFYNFWSQLPAGHNYQQVTISSTDITQQNKNIRNNYVWHTKIMLNEFFGMMPQNYFAGLISVKNLRKITEASERR
jgi:hypothetical protein